MFNPFQKGVHADKIIYERHAVLRKENYNNSRPENQLKMQFIFNVTCLFNVNNAR